MMAHTKEPWHLAMEDEYFYDGEPFLGYSILDADDLQIAIVPTDQVEEHFDNGRLMANAPEMHALLLNIRAVLENDPFSGSMEAEIIGKIDALLLE